MKDCLVRTFGAAASEVPESDWLEGSDDADEDGEVA
jgi:hypothetical protein